MFLMCRQCLRFLKKSIFETQPAVARDQLRAVPVADFGGLWKTLVAPVASLFSFDFVVANFQGLIDSLFSFVTPPQPALVPAGITGPRLGRPSGRVVSRAGFGPANYFPVGARNILISAGRGRTMVELTYDGHVRLVEPYKLEYYVRKKDGRGLEYFWGWDTTGGRSGKIGIKQFICEKIVSVRPTAQPFQPRFVVEL